MHVSAARCVDLYLEQRSQEAASSDKVDIDGRLIAIVERMFERYSCCAAFAFDDFPLVLNPHPPLLHYSYFLQLCT